jgi:hypothetical protein
MHFLTGKPLLRKTPFSGKNFHEELCGLKWHFYRRGRMGGEIPKGRWGYSGGVYIKEIIYKEDYIKKD